MGAIGFCMGGGFVLELAAQQHDRVSAAVPFYGLREVDAASITAHVQGHYGEKDDYVPLDAVRELFAKIRHAQLFTYDAGHAFYNDENLLGTYDREAGDLAFGRAVEFLHRHVI